MSSRSSSPLSSAASLDSDPELDFLPNKSTKTTNSDEGTEGSDRERSKSPSEASQAPSSKRRKVIDPRDPLPQDNPRYAFIIAFLAKFNHILKNVPNMGPQDLEAGVAETPIAENVEQLLCKLLTLALNRQKQVEKGHYARALEEAVATYIDESPNEWLGKNPLEGGKTFNQMSVEERLLMLETLVLWTLRHSRAIGDVIKESYKPGRKSDDSNVPVAVQPWGMDREKNKYYLIEGKDDTYFRVYQYHISPNCKNWTWITVAGNIDELRELAERLGQEGSKNSKEFQERILTAIPRFEEGEQKRKRREYRYARKAAFSTPGVSLYEGRTRGNKAKYTFDSDEEGGYTSGRATRASTRMSGRASPVEPYVTSSGRVTRRTNQYGFGNDNNDGASDSGASTKQSGRGSLKRDRDEYEAEAPDYEDPEEMVDDESENEGDYDGDDYHDEPADEMDDDDLSDASDEDDMAGKGLIATLKFKTEAGKLAMAKIVKGKDVAERKMGVENAVSGCLPGNGESPMDVDMADDEDVDDVDLVPTSPAHAATVPSTVDNTMTEATTTAGTTMTDISEEPTKLAESSEHVVVNFLKGSNSSPSSSVSQ
ncbi:hypothetical protein ABW19_dt0209202 [Dactylella cylindrospora]|nr:hypothetical protein ABW19_dt0209202 [Dactylella cylindrospora]